MIHLLKSRATHSAHLERWLGLEVTERISAGMRDWYGPPIAVAGVPGRVYAYPGGDFRGSIQTGRFANAYETFEHRLKRMWRRRQQWADKQLVQCNAGFSGLADLIAEAGRGKLQQYPFNKATGATNNQRGASLWGLGTTPAAGSPGAAAPGGTANTSASTGAIPLVNAASGDTTHFVDGFVIATDQLGSLLLYDRLFSVAKTMNSTATEAVTGVPTRYQSQTATDPDYIAGNFLFPEVTTAATGTAHNWTVCTYTDQAGAASTFPSFAGTTSPSNFTLDMDPFSWYAPLETGDVGVGALTQMQCSALVVVGAINFVIGHPIAWMPMPAIDLMCQSDGIYTAFNLARIFDNACLSFLDLFRNGGSNSYTGMLTTVSG